MVSPASVREQLRISRHLVSRDMDIYGAWPMKFGLFSRRRSRVLLFFYLLFTVHTFPSVFLFRLQTFFYDCGLPPVATTLSRINHILFGVTIGNHVRTSGGLIIAHGHVVLDGWTRLGDNVQINPFVTLGITNSERKPFELWGPTIGNFVNIGTGAKILGPVTIGDNVKIGANAVVIDDIPPDHTAVGAPARSFPTQKAGNKFEDGPRLPGSDS